MSKDRLGDDERAFWVVRNGARVEPPLRARGSDAVRIRSGFDDDGIARRDVSALDHPRVGAAPARVEVVIDAPELAVGNHCAFFAHGVANAEISNRAAPTATSTPVRIVVQSMPATVRFSPAAPAYTV